MIASGTSFPPGSPGELFYRTDTNLLNVYDGSDWVEIGATAEVSFDSLNVKAAVRAATTSNISLGGLQAVDGVSLQVGDRVLVKNQTATAQNGIYIADTGSWTRAADFDGTPASEVQSGAFFFVQEGSTFASTGWVLSTQGAITIGTTGLTFAQFTGANTGGTVTSVAVSGGSTGLTTSGGPITGSGTITIGGTLGVSNGGTGQTTANAALNALLPSQATHSGKVLSTDGTSTSWISAGGSFSGGTVTDTTTFTSATPQITLGTTSIDGLLTAVAGTTGRSLTLSAGNATTGTGGNITITAGNANTGPGSGGTITIKAGNSVGAVAAGGTIIRGGDGGAGAGGVVTITGGIGGTNSNGGDTTVAGGRGTGTGTGGNLVLYPSVAQTGGVGGYLQIFTAPTTALVERLRILNNGAWSVGTNGSSTGSAGQVLTSNGSTSAPTWQETAVGTAPVSATSTGRAGEVRYDADFVYICIATNTWKRSALSTW